jgi:hypothetical protein
MGDRGMQRKSMTEKEYEAILTTIYDKENILNYIEDELVGVGVEETFAGFLAHLASKNANVYAKLNLFMKETDKQKRLKVISDLRGELVYGKSN